VPEAALAAAAAAAAGGGPDGGGGEEAALALLAPPEPLCFVDFLREPVLDDETGEVVEAHPSHYEAVPGGLAGLRCRVEELLRREAGGGEAGGGGGGKGAGGGGGLPPSPSSSSSSADGGGLVLFDDALRHLARLSRVLAMERGSALLVGVGGSGRRSLARLAARLAGCTPFEPVVTRTYGCVVFFVLCVCVRERPYARVYVWGPRCRRTKQEDALPWPPCERPRRLALPPSHARSPPAPTRTRPPPPETHNTHTHQQKKTTTTASPTSSTTSRACTARRACKGAASA